MAAVLHFTTYCCFTYGETSAIIAFVPQYRGGNLAITTIFCTTNILGEMTVQNQSPTPL